MGLGVAHACIARTMAHVAMVGMFEMAEMVFMSRDRPWNSTAEKILRYLQEEMSPMGNGGNI
jgi:hypothetical protein